MIRKRVLLIEDCQVAQKVARFLFEKLDCELDLAGSGAEGISLAGENSYSLVIVDVGLPDISGIEAVEKLLTQHSEYRNEVPIVALTAHNDDEYKRSCLATGFTSYFCKPLTMDSAKQMISLG